MKQEDVLVFGWSDNPERYSNMAAALLEDYKHHVTRFNPRVEDTHNLKKNFDTITLYVNAAVGSKFKNDLTSIHCKRVIFNPGTENPELEQAFTEKGVEVIHGCTLVMLRTNQY